MDDSQKFYSDIEKIKKNIRASHPAYSSQEACEQVRSLFVSNHRDAAPLATSFIDYWEETFIKNSGSPDEEPTEQNIRRLAALNALLYGKDENIEIFLPDELKELCSLTNLEAEDVPIDLLNDIMTIFVDNKAL